MMVFIQHLLETTKIASVYSIQGLTMQAKLQTEIGSKDISSVVLDSHFNQPFFPQWTQDPLLGLYL